MSKYRLNNALSTFLLSVTSEPHSADKDSLSTERVRCQSGTSTPSLT